MKKQKGITLIALVITIIVLLILAGVSISMVIGDNGILKQANNAKSATIYGSEEEQVELAYISAKTQKLGGSITVADLNNALNENQAKANATAGKDKDGNDIILVTFSDTGNEYEVNGEIVTRVGQAEVTPDEPSDPNNGMYSVAEKVTPSPQELFNIAILDENAKTAEITGMNPQYIGKNSAMDYFYDDKYFYAYHAINHPNITDTLVIPYEVIPEGKDELYTVTKVNLSCSKTDEYNYGISFPAINTIIYPNTVTVIDKVNWNPLDASVHNIILSDNITVIPEHMFLECITLERITLPKNLKTIEYGAFWGCGALKELKIPSTVTSIGSSTIAYCRSLQNVYFESTVVPTFVSNCFSKSMGEKTTFHFKNSTVADALVEGTHYNATYGTKSENYNW